eukprot:1215573-Rhodomonas_salina.1
MDMNIYELIRGRRQYLSESRIKSYMSVPLLTPLILAAHQAPSFVQERSGSLGSGGAGKEMEKKGGRQRNGGRMGEG